MWRPGPPIWTDSQINQWTDESLAQITIDVKCIWARECLAIVQGKSTYRLPDYVRTLQRVTWRGKTLDPLSWLDFQDMTPGTVFLSEGSSANIETQSRPLYYAMHPTDPYEIRFHPCPNESFTTAGEPDPYSPTLESPSCIISYWRSPDPSNTPNPRISLPVYIQRRTQKAYVLWKAFAAEGRGQDLQASAYYQQKYQFLIQQFRLINEGAYVAKRYALGDEISAISYRHPRPVLPPNFERVVF